MDGMSALSILEAEIGEDSGSVEHPARPELSGMRRRDFLAASVIAITAIGASSWATAEAKPNIPPFAQFFNLRCRSAALASRHGGQASGQAGAKDGAPEKARGDMYGMIGKITTISGKRDEFIAILLDGIGDMPGCLSYVVARDASDADAIWVSEVWDSKASHDASLSLPSVKNAIAKGRPLIAGFSNNVVTAPVGGVGLPKHR